MEKEKDREKAAKTKAAARHERFELRSRILYCEAIKYYEPGRHDKCWRIVWKKLYSRYPYGYTTFIKMIKTGEKLEIRN
jgi:hypothetical protein